VTRFADITAEEMLKNCASVAEFSSNMDAIVGPKSCEPTHYCLLHAPLVLSG